LISHANQSYYAGRSPVGTVRRALVRLGFEAASQLVGRLVLEMAGEAVPRPYGPRLWRRAAELGILLRSIGKESPGMDSGIGYLAGLTHNLGQFALLSVHGEAYQRLLEAHDRDSSKLARAEVEAYGTHHARVAGAVLARLNMPDALPGGVSAQYNAKVASVPWLPADPEGLAALIQFGHFCMMQKGGPLSDTHALSLHPLATRLRLGTEALERIAETFPEELKALDAV
jgi:HD-like signal output (HDOD) protein